MNAVQLKATRFYEESIASSAWYMPIMPFCYSWLHARFHLTVALIKFCCMILSQKTLGLKSYKVEGYMRKKKRLLSGIYTRTIVPQLVECHILKLTTVHICWMIYMPERTWKDILYS